MSVNPTCPLCGWSDDLSFDNPHLQHADEVVCVWNTVERIDMAVERLLRKRTTLLRDLNASQASTKAFPREILSTIFEYACPPVDFSGRLFDTELNNHLEDSVENENDTIPFPPTVLGAVSSQWREIAWSTPRLWTSMARNVTSWSTRSSTNPLRLYLQNTSNMPFALDLDFRDKRNMGVMPSRPQGSLRIRHLQTAGYLAEYADPLPLEPLRHLIFIENPGKIIELRLNNPPSEWLPYFENNFSGLQTLLIGWFTGKDRRPERDIFPFENIPRLRKVAINNGLPIGGRWLSLNPMTITSLEICNIEYPSALEILSTYPNLVCFSVSGKVWAQSLHLPVTLPFTQYALKSLVWTFPRSVMTESTSYIKMFSHCTRLPSIQNLSLYNLTAEAVVDPAFHTFLSQLPPTLTSLSLTFPNVHFRTEVYPVFACLPFIPQSVSHLRIEECCPSLISFFFGLIMDPGSGVTLPALASVELINMSKGRYRSRCTQQCKLDLVPFLEFLRYRKAQGCLAFRAVLDCRACRPDSWDPDFQEEIGRFVDEGFDLKFRLDGESNYGF